MSQGFFHRRLIQPLLNLLRQGVTPEKLALSLALGIVLGIFPVLGSTTALCAVAAVALGLNLPAIQVVNLFVYPLQIVFLIPFYELGEKLFRAQHLPLSVPQIYAMIHVNMWNAIRTLWTTTWHGIIVWCLSAPVFAALAYAVLAPLFRRIAHRQTPRIAEAL